MEKLKVVVGHFELPARDPAALGRFYRQAFGWEVERFDWEGPEYVRLRPPGAGAGSRTVGGGLLAAEAAGFEQPLLVLHLEKGDLEGCLERIKAAGGRVALDPTPVADLGTFARFRDPEGHLLGLWQAAGA